jgi:N-acetylglucosamine malate deacetylase 2
VGHFVFAEFSGEIMPADLAPHVSSPVVQPWPVVAAAPPTIQLRSLQLAERIGRTLLLVPHYDDECAAGALLRQLPGATVLFLTDGAPRDPYFWGQYGTRESYSALRKQESLRTLDSCGVRSVFTLDDLPGTNSAADQELYRSLVPAFTAVRSLASRLLPNTILTPAFEGGHPDHDAASFLGAQVARHLGAEHWELPYYHRKSDGTVRQQEFLQHLPGNCEVTLWLTDEEIQQKRAMWSQYQSQCAVLRDFAVEKEIYRPAPAYAWNRAPHAGLLNYEAWQWNAKGENLTAAFQDALQVIG